MWRPRLTFIMKKDKKYQTTVLVKNSSTYIQKARGFEICKPLDIKHESPQQYSKKAFVSKYWYNFNIF